MDNPFDQFDNPNQPKPGANPFDQFDVTPSSAGVPPKPVGALPAGASASGTPAGSNQPTLPANPSTGDVPFGEGGGPTTQGIANTLRGINRGLTAGLWDPALGAAKSLFIGGPIGDRIAAERAATNKAVAEQGMAPELVGSMLSPANKLLRGEQGLAAIANPWLRALARPLGYGAEGAAYSGVKAEAEGQPVIPAMEKGAAFNAAAGYINPFLVKTQASPKLVTQDIKGEADALQQPLLDTQYKPKDVMKIATQSGKTLIDQQINPDLATPTVNLQKSFANWAQVKGQLNSVRQLLDYRDVAKNVGHNVLADAIDDHLSSVTPAKGPLASPDAVQNKIDDYTAATKNLAISKALDKQTTNIGGVAMDRPPTYTETKGLTGQGTVIGTAGQNVQDHAWRIAHSMMEPLSVASGLEGGAGPAATAIGVTTAGAGLVGGAANWAAKSQVPLITQKWRAQQLNAPFTPPKVQNQDWLQSLQGLILGGANQ